MGFVLFWVMSNRSTTINIYKISPSNYHRILQNKITDTYKLDNWDTQSQIDKDTASCTLMTE